MCFSAVVESVVDNAFDFGMAKVGVTILKERLER